MENAKFYYVIIIDLYFHIVGRKSYQAILDTYTEKWLESQKEMLSTILERQDKMQKELIQEEMEKQRKWEQTELEKERDFQRGQTNLMMQTLLQSVQSLRPQMPVVPHNLMPLKLISVSIGKCVFINYILIHGENHYSYFQMNKAESSVVKIIKEATAKENSKAPGQENLPEKS